jgi:hypothetical protein
MSRPRFPDRLALFEVSGGFRTGLVEVPEGGSRELELTCRLEADRSVGTGKGNDVAALDDGLPAEFGQALKKVADPAGFVIGRGALVGGPVDELLVFGADAPVVAGLLSAFEDRQQVGSVFDRSRVALVGARRHGRRA